MSQDNEYKLLDITYLKSNDKIFGEVVWSDDMTVNKA